MDWQKIVERWQSMFFMEPFQSLCVIFALITAILYSKKNLLVLLFMIYMISSLIGTFIAIYTLNLNAYYKIIYLEMGSLVVSFIELTAFTLFFYKIFQSCMIKNMLIYSLAGFFFINVYLFALIISHDTPAVFAPTITFKILAVQLTMLVVLCILYYYEVLKVKSEKNLFNRPSFWITSSLFFYCLTIIPFFLIRVELKNNYKSLVQLFFSVHDFSFALIFIALTNAFLCKKPLTT